MIILKNTYTFVRLTILSASMKSKTKSAPTIEEFRTILREKHLKTTAQRLLVHEAMLELGHASADMVARHVSGKEGHTVTIASIYNALSLLADLGIYQRRQSSNDKMYFDVNTVRHIHLYDSVNNTYKDIMDDEILSLVEGRIKGRKIKGYKIDSVDIQIVCHPARGSRKKTL